MKSVDCKQNYVYGTSEEINVTIGQSNTQKVINFDNVTGENTIRYVPNWPQFPDQFNALRHWMIENKCIA